MVFIILNSKIIEEAKLQTSYYGAKRAGDADEYERVRIIDADDTLLKSFISEATAFLTARLDTALESVAHETIDSDERILIAFKEESAPAEGLSETTEEGLTRFYVAFVMWRWFMLLFGKEGSLADTWRDIWKSCLTTLAESAEKRVEAMNEDKKDGDGSGDEDGSGSGDDDKNETPGRIARPRRLNPF